MADALGFFAPDVEVLRFPAWDCLPYDRVSPNPEIVAERVATLTRLLEPAERPRIVLTTVNALVQKVPPRPAFQAAPAAQAGRPRAPGGADRLPRSQRLWPRRHRDGARGIRHPRRHHRPLPLGRAGPDPARPVRRRDREHPPHRHRQPAQRRGAGAALAAACGRGLPRRGLDRPLPARLPRPLRRGSGLGSAVCLDQRRAEAPGDGALGRAVP